MAGIEVVRTPAALTFELRQRVLRPHQAVEEMALPGDDDPATAHFCVFDPAGRVVGTGSVRPEPAPREPDSPGWRLRGMATEPDLRSRGIGAAVLSAVVDHVCGLGGGLLWCHARLPAVDFYRRSGFVTRGEPWEEPMIGPHVLMDRPVPPPLT